MRITDRNWRCRIGELDLVGFDGEVLVVVEVKSSLTPGNVPPEGRVGQAKRRKLRALARMYTKLRRLNLPVRFDVVSVTWEEGKPIVQHIPNAF